MDRKSCHIGDCREATPVDCVDRWSGKSTRRRYGEVKVYCKSTNGKAELHCGVCGQGFVLFWERHPRTQRAAILSQIQETMRRHHRTSRGRDAHPNGGFLAPEWGDPNELAAATVKDGKQILKF